MPEIATSLGGRRVNASPPMMTPPKRRAGCGCLGSVTGAILLAVVVLLLLNPWALHMGGRWTPALTWHGVGKLQSSSGAGYGLYMEVVLYSRSPRRGSSSFGTAKNLQGTAKICTPQGDVYPLTVDGYLKSAWLDADGKPITFYLSSVKDAKPKLRIDLLGSWHGQELVLEDKGSMAMSFNANGTAKGYLQGPSAPKESANVSLHYATEAEFMSVCGNKGNNSF